MYLADAELCAGLSGFFGFTFSGLYKEVQRKYGKTVDGYLRAMRMAQGFDDCKNETQEECAEIIKRWEELMATRDQKKGKKHH
jgi:hypothetical protein